MGRFVLLDRGFRPAVEHWRGGAIQLFPAKDGMELFVRHSQERRQAVQQRHRQRRADRHETNKRDQIHCVLLIQPHASTVSGECSVRVNEE